MNGNRYLLDTNAVIALLQKDSSLVQLLKDAVIVATTQKQSAKLVSRDVQLNKVSDLTIISW